jgi:hypothetical protein
MPDIERSSVTLSRYRARIELGRQLVREPVHLIIVFIVVFERTFRDLPRRTRSTPIRRNVLTAGRAVS